jgi:hypothetical protein
MPPVLAYIAVTIASITVESIIAFVVKTIVTMAVNMAISAAFSKKPKGGQGAFSNYSRDRTLTVRQPAAPRRVIYGEVKVGGVMVFLHTTANDTKLHLIQTLAGHECQAIGDVYLNDEVVPLDGSGNATGKYAGYVRIFKHLGSASQTADTTLIASAPDKWTTAHRLQGVAYLYVELTGNADLFPNGVPNVSAIVQGKNDIYDPRTVTTGWSDNAALCVSNYLTDSKYGLGVTYASHINETDLIAAANICDEAVALTAGGTEARYALNGSFDAGQPPEDTIGEMLTAMHGHCVRPGARWSILAGAYRMPTITLDEDDARGPVKVIPRVSRRELFNAVKGLYTSPDSQWQPVDFPSVTNATYETEDNGVRIWRDISLPYTISGPTAQRIAKIELEKGRQQQVVHYPAKLTALGLYAGGTVKLSLARFGWVEKVFEVLTWRFEVYDDAQGEPALGIDLVLRETASANYDWSSGEETTIDPAPNTNLPDVFTVAAVSGLACASGTDHLLATGDGGVTSRIYVSWTALSSGYVKEYEVEGKKSSDTAYVPAALVRSGSEAYVSPVDDGVAYDVRVRAVNSVGVRGAWAYVLSHTVVGKTEPPAEPDTFTIARLADGTRRYAWTLGTVPADVRSGGGYKIRYYAGTTSDWSVMTDLHTGLLTSSPLENNELAAGAYTWAIKTLDSSGNESTVAKFISGTIGDPRLKNVLLQRIEQDLGWPGTLTGCFIHANTLIPLSTTTIAGLPATIAGLASTINAIGTNTDPIVYETPVIDLGADVSFTPLVTVYGTGTPTITMKTGTTADGTVVGAYGVLAPVAGTRYVQIKVSMADAAAVIQSMTLLLDAETQVDEFEDVNTATETATWFDNTSAGLGVGHFRIGSKSGQISSITQASIVALQGVGGAWTWELVNKSSTVGGEPAAEFKVRDASGTLADALVDVMIKGPKV